MTKDSLRKEYRQKRKALSDDQYRQLNNSLLDRFVREVDLFAVKTLHTFLPIYKNKEPDTWPIIAYLRKYRPDICITVPRIVAGMPAMDSVVLQDQALFAENQYGIEEPQGDDIVPPQAIDLIISPLLAFDLRGYRVGYGKGYYDRYFAACSPAMQKVGLSLFEPVEVISDTDPYDVPLDRVITAEATYTF